MKDNQRMENRNQRNIFSGLISKVWAEIGKKEL